MENKVLKTELRIGNIISDTEASQKGMWKVKELREKTCAYGCFTAYYNTLRPVPITIELLLKAGFKEAFASYHENIYIYNNAGFKIISN